MIFFVDMNAKGQTLTSCIPSGSLPFVKMSGSDLLGRIGYDQMREIVAGILCGENVRAATEPLTLRRIAILNAAILLTLVRASKFMSADRILEAAQLELRGLSANDERRTILMWIAGLTKKQIQNVLRSDDDAWAEFAITSLLAHKDSVTQSRNIYGDLAVEFSVDGGTVSWGWDNVHNLMFALGAQTLATRGAEKSMYGKYFEKLVLGSVLDILGFGFNPDREDRPMSFWLSERGEKRESDATAIIDHGEGVRFDIGFIGPGNTEVSLDKVSRFSRVDEINGKSYRMATVVIVDRIGDRSRIVEMAKEIDATILQMSSSLWTKSLDMLLGELFPEQYEVKFDATAGVKDVQEAVKLRLADGDLSAILSSA